MLAMTALTRRTLLAGSAALALTKAIRAQEEIETGAPEPAGEHAPGSNFDTSYRPSATVSARVQREFLETVRWSAGLEARDGLAAAFSQRTPTDIWLDLVEPDGLKANNVADALTAYWVLNWITANGAYTARVNNAPIQRQLRIAFSTDQGFARMGDLQKQELAEGYILNFLLEHAALNNAVEAKDVELLNHLAAASVMRFQRNMAVNLLVLEPSEEGFRARRAAE
jgi:hypothetical protein